MIPGPRAEPGSEHDGRERPPLRIVLADDSFLLREGVRSLLEDERMRVVASVADGEQLMEAVSRHRPELAIVDVRMPPTHTDEGLVAALELKSRFPEMGVFVLSQYVLREYATKLLRAETSGVGYLLKHRVTDIDRFLESVTRVADGGTAIDAEVVRQLIGAPEKPNALESLTARENEVLEAMAEGLSNRGIAERLFISISSVEKAVSSIFDRLELQASDTTSRRVAAVLQYLDRG